jgi:hypothetical protein
MTTNWDEVVRGRGMGMGALGTIRVSAGLWVVRSLGVMVTSTNTTTLKWWLKTKLKLMHDSAPGGARNASKMGKL